MTQADLDRALLHIPEDQKDAVRNNRILRDAFDEICRAAKVYQGIGPPMAYFQTPGENPHRFVYISFGMNGITPEGSPVASADTFAQVLSASIAAFRDWLKPNRTLVWRTKPEIELSPDGKKWASYWRCVQLEDNAKNISIDWHF